MTHKGENGWLGDGQNGQANSPSLGAKGHYGTGVLGLVATAILFMVAYPSLVEIAEPLHALSSTAIVMVGVAMWAGLWFLLEVAVDRRIE